MHSHKPGGHYFYRTAWNADAVERWESCPSVCPSVRPSVRLFVKRVNCDKTEKKSVQIFTPYERSFTLVIIDNYEARMVHSVS